MLPTLLLTPGLDPLRDQGRAYAAQTIAAGVKKDAPLRLPAKAGAQHRLGQARGER